MMMSRLSRTLVALVAAAPVALGSLASTATATDGAPGVSAAAPYYYKGWGDPPDAASLMSQTGVRTLTLAFMLSDGGCSPQWDGWRPLADDEDLVQGIRDAGGEVVVSFGGANGPSLEQTCESAEALAQAYQTVVDTYDLKAIDIDIEGSALGDSVVRERVVSALKTLKESHPDLVVYVTIPSREDGPDEALINEAKDQDLTVDGWTIMPFDFGEGGADRQMGPLTVQATEGLVGSLERIYGYDEDEAYAHAGISSMNGKTDVDETVTTADLESMLDFATEHHLARFTFWAANRDRPCEGTTTDVDTNCSGIDQEQWAFTSIVGRYAG